MDDVDKPKSRFSSGLNIIIRLDILWKDTHRHSRDGKYDAWNADLDRIWLELARDIVPTEFEDYKAKFDSYDQKVASLGGFFDISTKGFEVATKEIIRNRNEVYRILMEKQLFLARLENELGKGTTHDDDDDDF